MKNELLIIIILIVIANFIFLSLVYGGEPGGVQMQAIVPITPANAEATLNSRLDKINDEAEKKPVTKENKYLQFFAKSQEIQADVNNKNLEDWQASQTIYDKYASYGIMVLIMFICAVFLVVIIRFIDNHVIHHVKV